jgi:hypothetical protein
MVEAIFQVLHILSLVRVYVTHQVVITLLRGVVEATRQAKILLLREVVNTT